MDYRRRFPRRCFPDRHKFVDTYQQLRVHDTIQNVYVNAERLIQRAAEEENIFRMVKRGLLVSTYRLAASPFRERVWETLQEDFFCQYRVQQVQHLEVVDIGQRLEFRSGMSAHRRLAHYVLIKDEAQYSAFTNEWCSFKS